MKTELNLAQVQGLPEMLPVTKEGTDHIRFHCTLDIPSDRLQEFIQLGTNFSWSIEVLTKDKPTVSGKK